MGFNALGAGHDYSGVRLIPFRGACSQGSLCGRAARRPDPVTRGQRHATPNSTPPGSSRLPFGQPPAPRRWLRGAGRAARSGQRAGGHRDLKSAAAWASSGRAVWTPPKRHPTPSPSSLPPRASSSRAAERQRRRQPPPFPSSAAGAGASGLGSCVRRRGWAGGGRGA